MINKYKELYHIVIIINIFYFYLISIKKQEKQQHQIINYNDY